MKPTSDPPGPPGPEDTLQAPPDTANAPNGSTMQGDSAASQLRLLQEIFNGGKPPKLSSAGVGPMRFIHSPCQCTVY
jgi:hypothetical protein